MDDPDRHRRRTRKVTSAESPSAMVRRAQALLAYAERFGLDPEETRLLRFVLDGHRGPQLAAALDLSEAEVDGLEKAFAAKADTSVYEAAVEVLDKARRESSIRPPGG